MMISAAAAKLSLGYSGSARSTARGAPKLFRGDLGILDDFGPAQAILGDQLCQPFGRTALNDQALLVEKGLHTRLGQDLVEDRIVALDNRTRRRGRRKNGVPQIDIEIGYP